MKACTHAPTACSVSSEGTLSEHWEYARGKSVVMEFNRLPGGTVLLKRAGRSLGDSSFAAPGSVTRDASGYFDYGVQPGCGGMFSLDNGREKRFLTRSRVLTPSGE